MERGDISDFFRIYVTYHDIRTSSTIYRESGREREREKESERVGERERGTDSRAKNIQTTRVLSCINQR